MRIFPLIGMMTFALSTPFPSALFAQAESAQEEQPTQKAVKIEEIQVTAGREGEQGYGVEDATTATKTDTPLLEIPQAVSVVPRALLDDQGARKLDDALKNVAGVTPGGYYSDWDYYRLRGFDASFTTYWNGFRGDYGKNAELFGLERIEVVKGPASPLYGQGPLGGLVNLISKRPRPYIFANTYFTLGSYNFYEPAVDLGAPLNQAKTVYARLNALYRTRNRSSISFTSNGRSSLPRSPGRSDQTRR